MGFGFKATPAGRQTVILGRPDEGTTYDQPMQILRIEERKTDRGSYGAIVCQDEKGVEIEILAWDRDVKNLVNDWGENSDDWVLRWVVIRRPKYGTRATLEECNPPEQKVAV